MTPAALLAELALTKDEMMYPLTAACMAVLAGCSLGGGHLVQRVAHVLHIG